MKFKPGDTVPATTLVSVTGESIKFPDPNRVVHLQLRRFVDCPICNTHIAEMRGRFLLLGPDCSIDPDTPEAVMDAASAASR